MRLLLLLLRRRLPPSALLSRCVLAWLLLVGLPVGGSAGAQDSVGATRGLQIEGSWYVLIHYRTHAQGEPDVEQWDDRVWRFERRAAGLLWSEFPTPLFEDESDRQRELEAGRSARTLGSWQPNARQLVEIGHGLAVSRLGARGKSLSGSAASGYRSSGGLRGASASVIGYHESWRIEMASGLPCFVQEAEMAAARTDAARGTTRFEVSEILPGGNELRGRYERDGVSSGRFRMLRMRRGDER